MTFIYDFDNKTVFAVIYQYVTKRANSIQHYTGFPVTTIRDWIKKTEDDTNIFLHKGGNGRKVEITDGMRQNIIMEIEEAPNSASTRKLAAQFDVSHMAVYNILKDSEFTYRAKNMQRYLSEEEKENRVAYCKKMVRAKGKKLYNTFFSDEMGISLSDCHQKKAWAAPGQTVKNEPPEQNARLNCWGAISFAGATSLHIFKGGLKADRYQDILERYQEEMNDILPHGYHFQHDNLSAHTSVEGWAEGEGYEFVDFPTYSPDLNPIEAVWSTLKHAVRSENPKDEDELEESLLRNWEKVTEINALKPYFWNLERRYNECINKHGDRLPY